MMPGIDTGGGGFSGSSAATGGNSATGSNYQGGFNVAYNATPWPTYVIGALVVVGLVYVAVNNK